MAPPSSNDLQQLPVELLLTIGENLDQECQASLSLVSKHFHNVFHLYFDLALSDTATRVRFLHLLEHDHPEYLTCEPCGWMFNWRSRGSSSYSCPRTQYHARRYQQRGFARMLPQHLYPRVTMGREVVDLVARSCHRGPQFGISLSSLDNIGKDCDGVSRSTEARWVDNQLLVLTTWQLIMDEKSIAVPRLRGIESHLCLHWFTNIATRKWQDLEGRLRKLTGQEELHPVKCSFCATESRLCIEDKGDGRENIVIRVWQNYGSRYNRAKETEQIFQGCPESSTNLPMFERRNLEALYTSGSTY